MAAILDSTGIKHIEESGSGNVRPLREVMTEIQHVLNNLQATTTSAAAFPSTPAAGFPSTPASRSADSGFCGSFGSPGYGELDFDDLDDNDDGYDGDNNDYESRPQPANVRRCLDYPVPHDSGQFGKRLEECFGAFVVWVRLVTALIHCTMLFAPASLHGLEFWTFLFLNASLHIFDLLFAQFIDNCYSMEGSSSFTVIIFYCMCSMSLACAVT